MALCCVQMLQYYSKRFFNPFLVSMWTIPGSQVASMYCRCVVMQSDSNVDMQALGLYVVSDLLTPTTGYVNVQLWQWSGQAPVTSWNISYSITALNATSVT